MASKRSASDAGNSRGSPPSKKDRKHLTQFEPVKIGPISTLEEMDVKVLQFQNKKLTERIESRRKAEDDLRKRIEQLEQRQTTDDAVLCIVNRYWNQLDEDVRVLLQRFDAEGADESEQENESAAVTSFLNLLSQWDKPEIEEKLRQRVEFSKRAIGKLLTAYDRILQRNEKLLDSIKDLGQDKPDEANESTTSIKDEIKKEDDVDMKPDIKTEVKTEEGEGTSGEVKKEDGEESEKKPLIKTEPKDDDSTVKDETKEQNKAAILSDTVKEEIATVHEENKRLQNLVTELHQKHHQLKLRNSELIDQLGAVETEAAELKNNTEELQYNHSVLTGKLDKFDRHLADAYQKLKTFEEGNIKLEGGGEGVSKRKFEEIYFELEEQKELATNRFTELEKIQKDQQEALKEIESLKMDLSTLPESVVIETTEFKCLQSKYSVLYNESMHMKQLLEDARTQLQTSKTAHLRHIEQMESDELACQKQLRTEIMQLEDQLAHVRREYEMLRIEFEQTLAANEQTGPINREMRNLISSLKQHNEQLKGEVARYRRKLKEAQAEITKVTNELQKGKETPEPEKKAESTTEAASGADETTTSRESEKKDETPQESVSKLEEDPVVAINKEEEEERDRLKERGKSENEIIKELKAQLKKSQDSQKEMKLLLDMYKSVPKESRDKVQLMAGEKKLRQEVEDLKGHIRKMQEAERKEKRKLAEEDAIKKIQKMETTIAEQAKALAAQKQEEEALLNEMEVTGQAFEDMQEQNIRLLQQLREKDDANFKLMSERIKSNQINKLLREEKDILADQSGTLQHQIEAQMMVVKKLEEKERILQNNLATVEKELSLRQQAMESHKRKAVESAQSAADLKLHLDKYHAQLKEAQAAVTDKTGAIESDAFKYKRMQEQLASANRKLERAKKIESASSADEVLLEEIKEYKEQLTCPSCKVKRKDAVLTKCFHVFCLECLRTRYETRQRKCPKCNHAFGANDFHRLYLE